MRSDLSLGSSFIPVLSNVHATPAVESQSNAVGRMGDQRTVTVGVDTHADVHVAAALDHTWQTPRHEVVPD